MSRQARQSPGTSGFTLIEVLAVVMLMAIVFVFAIDFYLDLSRAGNHAAERMRTLRRASALLDRVARDLDGALLVRKPADVDPLSHPWVFLAEGDGGEAGAERLKFVARARGSRSTSSFEVVVWMLDGGDSEGRRLLRWSSPRLPEGLDRSFPRPDDEAAQLVSADVASFGVKLLGEEGGWTDRWDSSLLVDSGELPYAAEISVSFLRTGLDGEEVEEGPYQRQVLLPLRPLDLEELLTAQEEGAADDDELDDEEGATVADCMRVIAPVASRLGITDEVIDSILDQPFSRHAATFGLSVEDCQ